MSLPKHNPILKGLYFILVIAMFTFMIMVIKAYWPEDDQMGQWDKTYYQSYSETSVYLNYQNDYEVYTRDSNYNVLSQVAYVSIKS